MTEQETLMDDIERDITKVLQDNRHKMYQRMSAEKPSKEGSGLKYMVRYYKDNNTIRTKVLKPEKNLSVVQLASILVSNDSSFPDRYWVYDGKQNLIYSQI